MTQLAVPLVYLLAINLAAYAAMAIDKARSADGAWRIRERTLLTLAAVGGSPGLVAAQRRLRHKTWKEPFRSRLRLIVAAQLLALAAVAFFAVRAALAGF
ncbi:MAG: DUF1294 domain-containing protein [Bauldia sp.]